jgi:hypothetical protein
MKARRIKKLKNRISKFKPYAVHWTSVFHLFGEYSDCSVIVMADSFKLAITRFIHYEERKYKERSEYHDCYSETDRKWGKLMVIDERGYKKFYR